ncbi:hypothetical protein KBB96_20155 [Luteolibacter ambystomatis]|uniref:PEP-CTERM sorting domain-containing protein n=1 Tax=Luteolibacter ambystomatis TaxID=2824561 RepID=A0A975G879_9BACT|nr:hypothetical protein [Luteolibacter ambystomatis]QUE51154.1 hypothetical protein KBB96_20155 [Luteolibacter ambystomatis]
MKTIVALSSVIALSTVHTPAAAVVVNNGGFSPNTGTTATGWTDLEVGGGNVYYNPAEAAAPDDIAYLMASGSSSAPNFLGIYQNLSSSNASLTVSTYNSYTISFAAGFRSDAATGTAAMTVRLVDLGSDGLYQSSDAVLASYDFSRTAATTGTPVLTTENPTLTFSSPSINNIGLVFLNTTTGFTFQRTGMIDNVSATAVPEPSAAALAALAGLTLLARRRR